VQFLRFLGRLAEFPATLPHSNNRVGLRIGRATSVTRFGQRRARGSADKPSNKPARPGCFTGASGPTSRIRTTGGNGDRCAKNYTIRVILWLRSHAPPQDDPVRVVSHDAKIAI